MTASEKISEKYHDLWELKDKSYGKLDENKSIVIFLDGKDVTKNHKKYPMIGDANFTECMFECCKSVIRDINADAIIYAAIDELTVIFTNPVDVFKFFGVDGSASCICGLFTQRLVKRFWDFYECFFKPVIFQMDTSFIDRWITYRREICNIIGIYYVAKEFLPKGSYKDKDLSDVLTLLRKHNLTSVISSNRYICDGCYYRFEKDNTKFF